MSSGLQIESPFSQGVGYGIVIGIGTAFAVGIKYFAEKHDSEMFMTAKHSVKTGLTASAVVSSWTIAATNGYGYGVSGPFWYGAGASVQILLFSIVAIELKRKVPVAQKFLQCAKHRYGAPAHIVLTCHSLLSQCLSTVALLVGGAVFNVLTGVNKDALNFLFQIGVVIYTLFGGIKATFLTDWLHTYKTSNVIGSSKNMWELLTTASALHPVEGNAEGSYMTMRSQEGGYIGLIFVGSGFAAAVDSQLFQKAIAANPAGTLPGYLLGSISWFTIPFVLASTFGLIAAATEHLPSFPTYPNRMNSYEVTSGLAMPYAALSVMGDGGDFAVLLMVFMAVTSAMSSETVATTALLIYNFYHSYTNPKATGKKIPRVSHYIIPLFAIFAASAPTGLNHAGFSVSFLITVSGILVDSAIVPMACTIMWSKQSKIAVIASPLISSVASIMAWLLTAQSTEGDINITTLSANLALPENYDFEKFKEIRPIGEYQEGDAEYVPLTAEAIATAERHDAHNSKLLFRARKRAIWPSIVMTLVYLILRPIPMYATSYVFSKGFLKGWMVVVFLWAFFAASVITFLPIWESRLSHCPFCSLHFEI
ncbi:hypothetical protein N7493_011472 [Penicillium malachiteum]|uniref:Uncharacterized protein n=1 Tax=Penicillium malachiteum TaxID=1324776 RepID=A0AAD6HAQ0_9EURO|nr:hypothetical protein N7493_011472 [Penicillium malachiteum]